MIWRMLGVSISSLDIDIETRIQLPEAKKNTRSHPRSRIARQPTLSPSLATWRFQRNWAYRKRRKYRVSHGIGRGAKLGLGSRTCAQRDPSPFHPVRTFVAPRIRRSLASPVCAETGPAYDPIIHLFVHPVIHFPGSMPYIDAQ